MAIYGNSFGGDVLYNLRIGIYGIEGAFRFIAKDTVPVNKIRYFNTYSFTKPGYHSGNGGKIRIEIQEDDGSNSHMPSGKSLCFGLVPNPLQLPDQLLVRFDKTIVLQKDKIYHIVFTNYDANPEVNHVSIDMMSIVTPKPVGQPEQPELSNIDMTTLWRDKTNRNWRLFKDNLTVTPIFTLYYEVSSNYQDNVAVIGYGGMESWIREPRQIAKDKKVRQIFTPANNIVVNEVCVRIAKIGNPKDLIIKIEDTTKLIQKTTIKSINVNTINTTLAPSFRVGHNWVKAPINTTLLANQEYKVVLESDSIDPYETFPIRDGFTFGYAPIWANSHAEYTTSGETGWKGWDAWGKSNLKHSDLQLYFK